jgi:HD-like signal output (HDOD) protein
MYKILLVDDDQGPLAQLQTELKVISSDWDVVLANSGKEAVDVLRQNHVHVTITDLGMPGMNGVELLELIQAECPNCMRIAIVDQKDVHTYQRVALTAHQFIPKPWNAKDVASKIYQLNGLSNMLKQEGIQALVNRIGRLPSQSSAYMSLISELNRPEINLDNAARIISTDISMTAKLLQLVNSAYFGLPREIHEVSQAIFYLGTDTIRDLALSIQIFSQFDQKALEAAGLGRLWDHSLQVATLSRVIASSITNEKDLIASAFTAGLLHDIGKLVIGTAYPTFYSSITGNHPSSLFWLEEEKRRFDSSHADIGAYLLGIWGIPPAILISVSNHHNILGYLSPGFAMSVAVYFANYFSLALDANPLTSPFELDPAVVNNAWVRTFYDIWKRKCEQVMFPAK